MSSLRSWTLPVVSALAALVATAEAGAIDRSVGSARKVRAEVADDAVYIAARPELFAGKPVRIFCERLRNPDGSAMSCRANGTSIVIDTRLLDGEALRHAFRNCQGMTSTCSGAVSGVVEFARGVPYIVKAAIDFSEE